MVSLSFSSCNKDKDRKVSNSERLIGEWIYPYNTGKDKRGVERYAYTGRC